MQSPRSTLPGTTAHPRPLPRACWLALKVRARVPPHDNEHSDQLPHRPTQSAEDPQTALLQLWASSCPCGASHSKPPPAAGVRTSKRRIRAPPSHGAEHALKGDQLPTQFTAQELVAWHACRSREPASTEHVAPPRPDAFGHICCHERARCTERSKQHTETPRARTGFLLDAEDPCPRSGATGSGATAPSSPAAHTVCTGAAGCLVARAELARPIGDHARLPPELGRAPHRVLAPLQPPPAQRGARPPRPPRPGAVDGAVGRAVPFLGVAVQACAGVAAALRPLPHAEGTVLRALPPLAACCARAPLTPAPLARRKRPAQRGVALALP
eukprot:COSAG01_NODE_17728_length_1128_cov_2.384840_1_plen_327_part_01